MTHTDPMAAYLKTNEDMRWETAQFRDAKRVLTVAGSGDQALFYKLGGAEIVDTFDITMAARAVQDLKTTAIRTRIPFDEFIRELNGLWTRQMPSEKIFVNLPQVTQKVYQSNKIFLLNKITRPDEYMSHTEYEKLQSLITHDFNFIHSDIAELHTKLNGTYDIINLSNIFDNSFSMEQQIKILSNLTPYLRIGGKMLYIAQNTPIGKYKGLKFKSASGAIAQYHSAPSQNENDPNAHKMVVFERTL